MTLFAVMNGSKCSVGCGPALMQYRRYYRTPCTKSMPPRPDGIKQSQKTHMHYRRAVQALAALYSINREYDTALAPVKLIVLQMLHYFSMTWMPSKTGKEPG